MIKKNPTSKRIFLKIFMFLFLALTLAAPFNAVGQTDQEITYKVSVNVMLIPVFVTGSDGNPVFDLEKEDFELYANGTPVEISHFIRFDFEHVQEVTGEVSVKAQKPALKNPPLRAVFIILDSVFNDFYSYNRGKKIAIDMVKNSSPGDMFTVVENTAGGGIRYIGGSDISKKKLISRLKKLKLPTAKWNKSLFWCQEWNYEADTDAYDPVMTTAFYRKRFEKMMYRNETSHFSDALSRFKYALKTITRPKVVFLLSQGISRGAFKGYAFARKSGQQYLSALLRPPKGVERDESRDRRMFYNLERIVKAINEGGGVIYTINPGKFERDNEASGAMSMRFLAHESGGEYIAGSDTKKIIKKIKKTTAAYYELAFVPFPDMEKKVDIELKCKRKDVKVNTFKQTERSKPYFNMDPMEKKVFALNMVTGGSWSRIKGKVVRIKFKKSKSKKPGNNSALTIEIPLPEKMKDRQLDIFAIQMDPRTRKVDISMANRKVDHQAELTIKKRKNKLYFFVIIEPFFAYCIYNQV